MWIWSKNIFKGGDYDCVAVELCPPRLENLTNQTWWKNLDIYQVFRKKKAGLLLINLALTAYQKRLAERIGVEAGQEMIRAVELAHENNIRLEVIDRNISTTLHRLVTEVSFWQKLKIVGGMIAGVFVGEEISEQQIEDLKEGDLLHSVVSEFGEELPEIKRILIDERDQYMVGRLAKITHEQNSPKRMLALVGAGHLDRHAPSHGVSSRFSPSGNVGSKTTSKPGRPVCRLGHMCVYTGDVRSRFLPVSRVGRAIGDDLDSIKRRILCIGSPYRPGASCFHHRCIFCCSLDVFESYYWSGNGCGFG